MTDRIPPHLTAIWGGAGGRDARRLRLALALGVALAIAIGVALAIAIVAVLGGGGGHPRLPLPGAGKPARAGDPFAYIPSRRSEFERRALVGESQVLFTKSPGGALATATRVAAWRPMIDHLAAGSGIDPNVLEGIVFVESAGRPDAIAGSDPANASGLTQILAQTGAGLLGMHIELARSRRLTARIDAAALNGRPGLVLRLQRERAGVDDRFVPAKALAATIRYLQLAQQRLGRADLAVVYYHMGIGNLQRVLELYDGGRAVPYAQLYFDTAPDHHAAAFDLLASFGDDSSLYYWRVLGAEQIMRLYRTNRGALSRLSALELDGDVLHPPSAGGSFANPGALYAGYGERKLIRLPSNPRQLGLAYNPSIGWLAKRVGATPALYEGLAPAALDLLVVLAARVRALSGGAVPLTVQSAVLDRRYEGLLDSSYPAASTGYAFQIARRYVSRAQAAAFQAMLDRLQALNLIDWARTPDTIDLTVAADASRVIVDGP